MTYSRSGSTLLMGLLNTIPGYLSAARTTTRGSCTTAPPAEAQPALAGRPGAGDAFYSIGDFHPRSRSPGPQARHRHVLRPKGGTQ
jgi:hypothetical protein